VNIQYKDFVSTDLLLYTFNAKHLTRIHLSGLVDWSLALSVEGQRFKHRSGWVKDWKIGTCTCCVPD